MSLFSCAQNKEQNPKKSETKSISNTKSIAMNQNSNPETIIKLLIEAMQINEAEKIRSLFNENASQAYGDGAAKSGAAFFKWLDSDIIDRKGHVDDAKFTVNGNEVIVTGQYSSEGYTNKANFLFTVEDNKIMSWRMRY